jgi:3-oxoacyl-[acyl-carrier-protein] synthase-3
MYMAGITGIGISLPEKVLTNLDLEKMVDTSDEWITSRTGIKERRIADKDIAASDLSSEAAKEALEMSGVQREDIDLIIVCTVTPDMMYPATAAIVQHKIGAKNAAVFDLSAGCTGFINGVTVAKAFIKSGIYKNIIVVGCDILSRVTNFYDRNTCALFGDGAGAVVISRTDEPGIIDEYLMADGSGGDFLTLPAGGSRMPASIETIEKGMHYTNMDGKEVFKFAVKAMPEAVKHVLDRAGIGIEEIDCLVPHQANIRIIESAAKRLEFPMDKVAISIDKYGNMSSATIPITLYEAYKNNKIVKGNNVVLVGFGAGLTYGAIFLKWLI